MRALVAAVLVLTVLWGGYWFAGSRALERAAEDWFAAQAAAGRVAERQDLSVAGFPSRFDLTVTAPRLADPQSGWGWEAPFVQVFSLTYKPWHVIAALPNEQRLTTPGDTITLTSAKAQASLVVEPGTDLTLDRSVLVGEAITAAASSGWTIGAEAARLATRQDPARTDAHEIGLEVANLALDESLVAALERQSDLPGRISLVRLDAIAGLTAPIDRHFADKSPRLREVEVKEGLVRWGDLAIFARGTLTTGPDGLAQGRIDIRVENWRKALPAARAAGLLTPDMARTLERGLEAVAQAGGNADVLALPLTMQDGWMALGPLPLGPAPRFD